MSTDLLLIVDERSDAFSFSWTGGNTTSHWDTGSLPQWYGGTTRFANSSTTQIGVLTFTFNGTSASFTGNTPPPSSPQTATVRIDDGTPFVISYQDPTPQTYMQWFITPALPDGSHTIVMSDLNLIAIDYAVVKVGNRTPLNGKTVIVDDDSSLIQYSGQWTRSTSTFIPTAFRAGYPYGNLTHRSSNPGDTFTFQFSGTSIAVYGIFSWYNLGSLSTTYTLDGRLYSSPITVTASTPGYNEIGEVPNYVHFRLDNLSPGTHTLFANITEVNNLPFILDYITYTPSFETLSAMPSFSPNATTNATTVSNKPFATSDISGVPQHSVSTGTIVGSLLGGVAFGVLVTALVILLILRRRRAQRSGQEENHSSSYQVATRGSINVNPNYGGNYQLQEYTLPGPTKYAQNPPNNSSMLEGSPNAILQSPTVGEVSRNPPSYDVISDRI